MRGKVLGVLMEELVWVANWGLMERAVAGEMTGWARMCGEGDL